MLALTPTAAEAVEAIVAQPEAPEGAVLRITSEEGDPDPSGEETRDLQLAVVEGPAEDDVRVQGIAISVEPETLGFLDDKVLDAEISEGGVRFRLYLQPPEGLEGAEPGSDPAANGHANPSPDGNGPTT
jgi:Fe-S cluster assembly iron-binding protein IscA